MNLTRSNASLKRCNFAPFCRCRSNWKYWNNSLSIKYHKPNKRYDCQTALWHRDMDWNVTQHYIIQLYIVMSCAFPCLQRVSSTLASKEKVSSTEPPGSQMVGDKNNTNQPAHFVRFFCYLLRLQFAVGKYLKLQKTNFNSEGTRW